LVSGNRRVFDEEGNALEPLAQLAAEGLGSEDDDAPPAAVRWKRALPATSVTSAVGVCNGAVQASL
jgi:hypothetical protein